jgi:hypothetical protein
LNEATGSIWSIVFGGDPHLFRHAAERGDFMTVFLNEVRGQGLIVQRHSDYWLNVVRHAAYLLWFAPLAGWPGVIALLVARHHMPATRPTQCDGTTERAALK